MAEKVLGRVTIPVDLDKPTFDLVERARLIDAAGKLITGRATRTRFINEALAREAKRRLSMRKLATAS